MIKKGFDNFFVPRQCRLSIMSVISNHFFKKRMSIKVPPKMEISTQVIYHWDTLQFRDDEQKIFNALIRLRKNEMERNKNCCRINELKSELAKEEQKQASLDYNREHLLKDLRRVLKSFESNTDLYIRCCENRK